MNQNTVRSQRRRITQATGKQGSRFLDRKQLALEVHKLTVQGYSAREIAKIIDRSERYVRELRAEARDDLAQLGIENPDPKLYQELPDEFKQMVEPYWVYQEHQATCFDGCELDEDLVENVVRGYASFFNRFSGRILPEHAREWVAAAFTHRRVLLNVPPRHAKSTVMSVWLPIYLVCCDRNVQVLIVSQTGEFAIKFCREIAEHFENDRDLIVAFGKFVPSNQSWTWAPNSGSLVVEGRTRLSKPGDMTIQIRGAQQQILGMEADWIFCDDPDSPDIVKSETQRGRLLEWFNDVVITRLNPGGHVVVIGQRLALNDLYGSLAKKKRTRGEPRPLFKHINYPAVINWESQETLWPDEWPFSRLMDERYEDLGKNRFECLYQQNPMPAGQMVVRREWIEGSDTHVGCLDRDRGAGQGYVTDGPGFFPLVRVLSADPSPTRQAGIMVADVLYSPEQFTATLIHTEGTVFQARDFLARLDELMLMFGPIDYLVIEESAVSKWIFQDPWWERKKNQVRLLKHSTHAHNKGDQEYGVQSLAVDFEFGRVRLPYGDADGRAMTDKFLGELYTWPEGEYDDQLMALWFIKYVARSLHPYRLMQRTITTRGTAFDSAGGAWEF